MKYIKLYLFILLFSILFTPLSFSATEPEYFTIVNKYFSKAVLPLSFVKGLPVVMVTIEDQLFHLILDTGADRATIDLKPDALNKIKVKYLEDVKNSLDVYGNAYQSRTFEIPQLQLGKLKFTDFIAGEELRDFVPGDGIIGNRFLKNFYVLFDYQKNRAVLYPKGEYPRELNLSKWRQIDFEHNDIGIIISVKIDTFDRELKFCLDSGSGSSGKKKSGLLRAKALEGLTEKMGRLVTYDHVSIAGIDLGRVDFFIEDFQEPPVDGFFGDYFFSRFKTLIDFDRNVLFVKE
jgi:hypothetical protein